MVKSISFFSCQVFGDKVAIEIVKTSLLYIGAEFGLLLYNKL